VGYEGRREAERRGDFFKNPINPSTQSKMRCGKGLRKSFMCLALQIL
jgi:hypothetical protein